jgi:hypothetical protein
MARRLRCSAAALIVAVVLSACGVPTQSEPKRINAHDVPFDLLKPAKHAPATTTTTTDEQSP